MIPFAFFFTSFSRILLLSQIPNDLTILFFGSSFTVLFLKITSLFSGLVFVFITTSFDLDLFISISLAQKNSSANAIISINCSLLLQSKSYHQHMLSLPVGSL